MSDAKLTLADFLPYQLSITSNAVSDVIARSYRGKFGLKIPEWRVMAVLGENAALTQRELAQATAMDKVMVNRASKALVDRGLIGRAPNEADGRSHHLQLSETGRDLYEQIVPLAVAIEGELESALSTDEARQLTEILSKLRSRAQNME